MRLGETSQFSSNPSSTSESFSLNSLRNSRPCCASPLPNAHFSSEGAAQTTAAEVAAFEQRAKAALIESAKAFPKGTKVTWNGSDSDVPEGTVGTVLEPKEDTPGNLRVAFPAGTWGFFMADLRRA